MASMVNERIIKRYSAYYAGWAVSFGEHELAYDQERDIQWVFGEDKAGITLASHLSLKFVRELLGRHGEMPEIALSRDSARVNQLEYRLEHPQDLEQLEKFRAFVDCPEQIHMFLTSHFCYPQGTRIITFAKKAPLLIVYKEIDPLRLLLV